MKKQTENTFTEGLVLDLHPLTTPNNVLTDALNATLITMNGNEFVLLNDMGNGRVEKAYLPPGYVPVGIKEFGGVIYVASYNPLTNKGQIGSFPSPERNIDLEELVAPDTTIGWEDFYDENKGECKTFVTKVQLFGGKVMRSGDKFTIYFDNETTANAIKLLSNYNNIDTNGNAVSPKKNTLSISFTVLDSNNNLRDITSLLKRFKDGENTPITFDPSTLPVIKENTGYFIEHLSTLPSSTSDTEFVKERQKRAVNTYNNKLFGKIFLTIQLNIIDHIDVSVYGFKKNGDKWELPSGYNISEADLTDNNVILVFDTEYVYNCPDGFTDGNTLPATIPGYSGYLGKYNYSVIKGVQLKLGESLYTLNFPTNSPTTDKPYYNQIDNLYSIKLSAYLPLTLDSSKPVFNYTITPWMTYSPLNGLAVDGSIDLSKLGSGENTISTWKYYCDNDKVRLTWGFNSYPSYGTKITDVVFHFYDILSGTTETETIEIEPRTTYNGTFTLNISYGTIALNSLYLVLVSYNVKTDAGESIGNTKYAGARWLLTNGVFNRAYLTNSDSSIQDYNDFVTTTLASNSDGYNDNTCVINNSTYKRYEFKDSVKDLIRIDLNSKWNQNYLKHDIEYRDLGVVWKDSNNASDDDKKYLSKKTATILDTLLKLSVTDSINDNFPFELNAESIKHTFTLNQDNKGGLSHDALNIIGNLDALKEVTTNDIFTPDDDSEYGNISTSSEGEKNWLDLSVTSQENTCKLTMKSGIHSLIAGASLKRSPKYSDCYEKFLSDDTFLKVFGYPKTDNPNVAIRVMFDRSGGGTWHDDKWWLYSYILSGSSVSLERELFYDSRHTDLHLLFADYLGPVSEEINNKMGAPVIAFMKGGGDAPDNSLIYNDLIETNSYILVFWRGVDGKYYIVDVAKFNEDSSIIYDLMSLFESIYIYKSGPSTYSREIYQINTGDNSFVYMEDFEASIFANLDISCTKLANQSVLYVKNSSNKYLDTLIKNTRTVLTNKDIISVDDTTKVSLFVSGVWFVVKTNQEETKQYSETITVKGTIEDVDTLSSLYQPVTNVLIGDNKIYTEDGNKVAFSPANIYYCGSSNNDEPYPVTSTNEAASRYAALAEQFNVTSYKQTNLLLVNSTTTRDIGIWSPWISDDNSGALLHFQGMPTVELKNLPGASNKFYGL